MVAPPLRAKLQWTLCPLPPAPEVYKASGPAGGEFLYTTGAEAEDSYSTTALSNPSSISRDEGYLMWATVLLQLTGVDSIPEQLLQSGCMQSARNFHVSSRIKNRTVPSRAVVSILWEVLSCRELAE